MGDVVAGAAERLLAHDLTAELLVPLVVVCNHHLSKGSQNDICKYLFAGVAAGAWTATLALLFLSLFLLLLSFAQRDYPLDELWEASERL